MLTFKNTPDNIVKLSRRMKEQEEITDSRKFTFLVIAQESHRSRTENGELRKHLHMLVKFNNKIRLPLQIHREPRWMDLLCKTYEGRNCLVDVRPITKAFEALEYIRKKGNYKCFRLSEEDIEHLCIEYDKAGGDKLQNQSVKAISMIESGVTVADVVRTYPGMLNRWNALTQFANAIQKPVQGKTKFSVKDFLPDMVNYVAEWEKQYEDMDKERFMPLVVAGPTQTGKTTFFQAKYPGAFWHNNNINWTGYKSEDTIIFDDCAGIIQQILANKKIFQATQGAVTVHGSQTNCFARSFSFYRKKVIILSNTWENDLEKIYTQTENYNWIMSNFNVIIVKKPLMVMNNNTNNVINVVIE